MKNTTTKINKKQRLVTWSIRICCILLVALLVAGSCYYTIWALLA